MTRILYTSPQPAVALADCEFYHTCEIPGVGLVKGQWDLRSGVKEYLGHYDFANKRVLEIGPASGFLTFYIESLAEEVVAVDLPLDGKLWDFVPLAHLRTGKTLTSEGRELERSFKEHLTRIRNGFWLGYEMTQSSAKVCYCKTSDLPEELGTFDVAVLGSILLHTQCPLSILDSCAERVTGSIIVTEPFVESLGEEPICRLLPSAENKIWHTWWQFTPRFFAQYLHVLGFSDSRTSRHTQSYTEGNIEMFTVLATRPN